VSDGGGQNATTNSRSGLSGPVVLQLPAEAGMARVARLTASSLASLARLSIDDIDDVKIVVSEVMAALVEHGDGSDVTLKFDIGERHLVVSGYTLATTFKIDAADMALSATVLGAIASHHTIEHTDGQLLIVARYDALADDDESH